MHLTTRSYLLVVNIIMRCDNVAARRWGSVSAAGSRGAVVSVVIVVRVTYGTASCVRSRVRAAFHRGDPSPPLADPA